MKSENVEKLWVWRKLKIRKKEMMNAKTVEIERSLG